MDTAKERAQITSYEKMFGPASSQALLRRELLAEKLAGAGEWVELANLRRETLQLLSDAHGPAAPQTLAEVVNLAHALTQAGEHRRALSLVHHALRMLGPDEVLRVSLLQAQGLAYWGQGDLAQARQSLGLAATEAERLQGRRSAEAQQARLQLLPLSERFAVWPEVFALKAACYLTDLENDRRSPTLPAQYAELQRLAHAHGLQEQWEAFDSVRAENGATEIQQSTAEPDTVWTRWRTAVDAALAERFDDAAERFIHAAELAEARRCDEGATRARLQASLAYERIGNAPAALAEARAAVREGIASKVQVALWATAVDRYADTLDAVGQTERGEALRASLPRSGKFVDTRVPRAGRPRWLPLFDLDTRLADSEQLIRMGSYRRSDTEARQAFADAEQNKDPLLSAMAALRLAQALLGRGPVGSVADPKKTGEAAELLRLAAVRAEQAKQPLAAAYLHTTAGRLSTWLHQTVQASRSFERALWLHSNELGEPLTNETQLEVRYPVELIEVEILTRPLPEAGGA